MLISVSIDIIVLRNDKTQFFFIFIAKSGWCQIYFYKHSSFWIQISIEINLIVNHFFWMYHNSPPLDPHPVQSGPIWSGRQYTCYDIAVETTVFWLVSVRVALHVSRRRVLFPWNKTNRFSIDNPMKIAENSGELKLVELIYMSVKSVTMYNISVQLNSIDTRY